MQKRAKPRKPDVAIIIVSVLFVPLQPKEQEIFGKMFTVILLMLAGIAAGYLLRRRVQVRIQGIITLLIWALLFILGVEVGSDERIISALHTLGGEALLLATGGTLGSVLAAWGLWKLVQQGKGGRK